MKSYITRIAWFIAALQAAACHGDYTSSTGEMGRISYGLYTDYESHQGELTDLPMMTGYPHSMFARLTSKGERKAGRRGSDIVHRTGGAAVSHLGDGEDAPDFRIETHIAKTVTLESVLDGEVFDYIELEFKDPTHLDLVTWVRQPWEEDFHKQGLHMPMVVEEGTQISFLAVPMADDLRLAGDFTPEITVDPPSLAVPDAQVVAVQEGGLTLLGEPVTYYAIEPGTVTFTLTDPVHGVEVVRVVEIIAHASDELHASL